MSEQEDKPQAKKQKTVIRTAEHITQEIYAKLDEGKTVKEIAEVLTLDDKLILAKATKKKYRHPYYYTRKEVLPKWKANEDFDFDVASATGCGDLENKLKATLKEIDEYVSKHAIQDVSYSDGKKGCITIKGIYGDNTGNVDLVNTLMKPYNRKKTKEKNALQKEQKKLKREQEKAKAKILIVAKRAKDKAKKAAKAAKEKALKAKLKKALANATGIKDSEAAQLLSLFACKK